MKDLVKEFHMAILFITHDLGVIAQTADQVAVMYLGKLIEKGSVRQVLRNPQHPYTRGLLDALPRLDDLDRPLKPVEGDIPSPLDRPSGCVFNTRCPVSLGSDCETIIPEFTTNKDGQKVACLLAQKEGVEA
jgi:oligopeptide/dipeptide ABC transporter ATP-binding protein